MWLAPGILALSPAVLELRPPGSRETPPVLGGLLAPCSKANKFTVASHTTRYCCAPFLNIFDIQDIGMLYKTTLPDSWERL